MANGVRSEWQDIHVKLGNYLPYPKVPTSTEIAKETMEKAEKVDPLKDKDLEELKELEDEFEDEFLQKYKQKRMEEIKMAAKKSNFGTVMEINKQEYIAEVTNAPKDVFVVISLYQGK